MSEIVLGRVGHYSVPKSEETFSCNTAIIAHVNDSGTVNLSVLEQDGTSFPRTQVPVSAAPGTKVSFHLNRDCPEER